LNKRNGSSSKKQQQTSDDQDHLQSLVNSIMDTKDGKIRSMAVSQDNKDDTNKMNSIVPATLSAKESKKFCKDAWHKASSNDGKDDPMLVFVVEGEELVEEPPKKNKQRFPNIKKSPH
jgi:hypothetical protein